MDNSFTTPILFLIFNRPDVTSKVFGQIRNIKPKYLYVAADGPRQDKPDDFIFCQETRRIIEGIDWECELKTLYRNENLGCGFAVCSAITWFFDQVEEGIILEDDCFPDISFFHFCGDLLSKYKEDESIFLISGTNLQNGNKRGNGSYYFSNHTITWGWASWRRARHHFNYDIVDIDQSFKSGKLDHVFQSISEKSYWRKKIKMAELGKKNIWDYQWFYTTWKNNGIGITSNVNLIINLGFRNNAIHTFLRDSIREPETLNSIQFPLIHPAKIIDRFADQYTFKNAFSHSISRLFRLTKENGIRAIWKYSIPKVLNKINEFRY